MPNKSVLRNDEKKPAYTDGKVSDRKAQIGEQQIFDTSRGENVPKPTMKDKSSGLVSHHKQL